VEAAFYSLTAPDIATAIERSIRLGARRVVMLPYLLFTGAICRRTGEQAQAMQARYPDVEILVAGHLSTHPEIIEAVKVRYQEVIEGTATMTCDLCKYRHRFAGFEDEYGLPQRSDHHHGLRGLPHTHGPRGQSYEQALETILPARYQNGQTASVSPMAPAPLKYDSHGQVAWDEIWTDFCDLALAGGPSQRGELLEPVLPEAVAANPPGYQAVLAELERGLRLVTGLPVVHSRSPGWVGLVCESEAMALWLLRAVVVENVSVRREGALLFLPAGPDFRLEYEIKNIITVAAKTHHYWSEHVLAVSDQRTTVNG
jgi:sirohydrochlorin cobaltochelatase